MKVTLTEELESFVQEKVRSGRYANASDVMRDALRALELRDDYDSPALEAALLEGIRGQHRPYGRETLNRVRRGHGDESTPGYFRPRRGRPHTAIPMVSEQRWQGGGREVSDRVRFHG